MPLEIERKFLVRSDAYKAEAFGVTSIRQGYLSSLPGRSVRVRTRGDKGYITIKGRSNASGTTRFEWEKEITLAEAEALMLLCEEGVIEKKRYEVKNGNFIIEVDEFFGLNAGLVMAEIELTNETDAFDKPAWLGEEVTGNRKYYNSALIMKPFTKW